MERLGRNESGYCGETIDIHQITTRLCEAARADGWSIETFGPELSPPLVSLKRVPQHAKARLYLSAGIHGDEPAGPVALCRLLEKRAWPPDLAVWICPCLNPTGFPLNSRHSAAQRDLNRDYRHAQSPEIAAHIAWLDRQPEFDLTLCLHEDWEADGFYLYELNPTGEPSLSQVLVDAVASVCPIDRSAEIDGWPADHGILRPPFQPEERSEWPEAFYLVLNKTRHSYTLETPSDFPLEVRVHAHVAAVERAIAAISRTRNRS